MAKYNKISEHWAKYGPPVYIAVAAYLGLISTDDKPKPKSSKPIGHKGEAGDLASLHSLLSRTGGVLHG